MATIKTAVPQRGVTRPVGALLAAVVLILATGCGLFRPSPPVAQHEMPNLPRAGSLVAEGDTVSFQHAWFTFVDFKEPEREGARPDTVRYKIWHRGQEHEGEAQLNEYRVDGDYLVQFRRPDQRRTTDGTRRLVALNLWHLPSLHGGRTHIASKQSITLTLDDIVFFPGGFVSLRGVDGGDYRRFNDDSATLTLYHEGRSETRHLFEFQWAEWNGLIVEMRNVYPGDTAEEGRVSLILHPPATAIDAEAQRERLTLQPGSRHDLGDIRLTVNTVEEGPLGPGRILLVAEEGEELIDMTLAPGEGLRFSDRLFLSHGLTEEGEIALEAIAKEERLFAAQSRIWLPPSVVQAREEATRPPRTDPTTIRRTVQSGQAIEFWDATFQLDRVERPDRTRVFSDTAEVTITYDNGIFDTRMIREGDRNTVTGSQRWWIIELHEIRPSGARPGQGEVVMELSTGVYLGQEGGRQSPAGGITDSFR